MYARICGHACILSRCCVNTRIMCHSWPYDVPWFHFKFCLCGKTLLSHLHEKGCQTNTFSCFSPSSFPTSPSLSTALIAIGQYSSTIETVDAGWCKDITDQGATQIAQSSKSLRYLGLMRCDKVTNITHIVVFLRARTHKPKGWSGGIWQPTR